MAAFSNHEARDLETQALSIFSESYSISAETNKNHLSIRADKYAQTEFRELILRGIGLVHKTTYQRAGSSEETTCGFRIRRGGFWV